MNDEKRDFPGVGDDAFGATDPDMETKLGAELEFRGDVLESDLAAAQQEAEEWREKALRAAADLDNFRKRTAREREEERARAAERVVREMLPVLDDLERAVDHIALEHSELTEGLLGVVRNFSGVLDKEGVVLIDPLGQPFDPMRHNAVQMKEDTEVADHTVVEVFQKGYEMHGRVLRPAMVIVSTGGPATAG